MYSSPPNTKNSKELVKLLIQNNKKFTFPDNLLYLKPEKSIQIFKVKRSVEFIRKNNQHKVETFLVHSN